MNTNLQNRLSQLKVEWKVIKYQIKIEQSRISQKLYKLKITQMQLLQSLITNQYPTISTLLKYWLTQLIDIIITLLTAYPINVLICIITVIIIVYKILNKFFGKKIFKAKYKPLQHKQNIVNQMKNVKKQIRQIQGDIIQIKKKFNSQNSTNPLVFDQQINNQAHSNSNLNSIAYNNQSISAELEKQIKQKISKGHRSLQIYSKMQNQLIQSNEKILKTLKQINQKS